MRKVIGAINMTVDGFCDHTAIDPDDELHQHYSHLLRDAGVILYGRITYHLMEYWKTIVESPSGNKATDEFASIMNKIPKVLFSHTLSSVDWDSARLATTSLQTEVVQLKNQPGNDILVGSRSLIIQLIRLRLLDELQLCIHPVIAGSGLPLFENLHDRTILSVKRTKAFVSGAMIFYYEPTW